MKADFDTVSAHCSKYITKYYSTSFSIGILFLDREFHKAIYAIYGFVRFADEIVDSFEGYDKEQLLTKFKMDTNEAIEQKISLNPILNSFQQTVHEYQIKNEFITVFLDSMTMDLENKIYDLKDYNQYIFGSAEVVGLMCLQVFTKGDEALFKQLKPAAMRLGAALQKVNFLRDAKADYEKLGRTYFPNVNLANFTAVEKQKIEADIINDFSEALKGIKQLPKGARRGVYVAYFYYNKLFNRIKRASADAIMKKRIRIPNAYKLVFMVNSYVRHQVNMM